MRPFGKTDFVMRAKNRIYHQECFSCVVCEKQLVPGDEFSLRHDELYCKEHSLLLLENNKDGVENNNNFVGHHHSHNASNSSEDNSEGEVFQAGGRTGRLSEIAGAKAAAAAAADLYGFGDDFDDNVDRNKTDLPTR